MKKFILNIFILIAVAGAGALVAWWVTCDDIKKEGAHSPEEVITDFYTSLAEGDWEDAASVCDTTQVQDYIENYREVWESGMKRDSVAIRIASGILAEAKIDFMDTDRVDRDNCSTTFTLSAGKGMVKTRKAELRRIEGKWVITSIIPAE